MSKTYECIRCMKQFIGKHDVIRHLNKKNKCYSQDEYFNYTEEEVFQLSLESKIQKKRKKYEKKNKEKNDIDELEKKEEFICEFCKESFGYKHNRDRHSIICTLNPLKNKKIEEINLCSVKKSNDELVLSFDDQFDESTFFNKIYSNSDKVYDAIGANNHKAILKKLLQFPRNINIIPLKHKRYSFIKYQNKNHLLNNNNVILKVLEKIVDFKKSTLLFHKPILQMKNEIWNHYVKSFSLELDQIENDLFCDENYKKEVLDILYDSFYYTDLDVLCKLYDIDKKLIDDYDEFVDYLLKTSPVRIHSIKDFQFSYKNYYDESQDIFYDDIEFNDNDDDEKSVFSDDSKEELESIKKKEQSDVLKDIWSNVKLKIKKQTNFII